MKKIFKLGSIKGWKIILTCNTKRDSDFHDEFHLSATLSNCWSLSKNVKKHNKYLIFELFCRRLVELKFTKLEVING